MKDLVLKLFEGDRMVARHFIVDVPDHAKMLSTYAVVEYSLHMVGNDPASSALYHFDRGIRRESVLVTWDDVEQIAAWVRGDGSDPQRQALADGILRGWSEPFAPSPASFAELEAIE